MKKKQTNMLQHIIIFLKKSKYTEQLMIALELVDEKKMHFLMEKMISSFKNKFKFQK